MGDIASVRRPRLPRRARFVLPILLVLAATGIDLPAAVAGGADDLPTIAEATEGMERLDGFLPVHWDSGAGTVHLEVPRIGEELIYVQYLSAGVGSNDIGLDRGQLGSTKMVRFERHGPKLLMVEPNTSFRADTDNPAERRAVEDAFARSVIWGFEIEAEGDGRLLVDATDFLLRDAHGVAGRLAQTNQGKYRLETSRSAPYRERTAAFPENTELEATLTFVTDEVEGSWVRSVTPTPNAVTVRQHHSFVKAPPPGYEPRASHPGGGFFGITYRDYGVPIEESIVQRLISRHRLQKADADREMGEPVEPIVYYLDPGTPEPVRSALLEGARWWNRAFEAAGYEDAFRVEMLPEGADMLDVRYNVIQWVHRSTRGWSYGSSVVDPRTGEILKGHVTLGSLRVRQDFLIAEGLLSPYEGDEVPPQMKEMALARIRQLAAHEVGHTLGLSHNYIASTQGRASVMDYPHPLARLDEDGGIDLSDAYDVGIGEWDEVAIQYGYRDFPEGTDVESALERILVEARDRGITFLSDQDARPPGSAHPRVHLWDNGVDAAAELNRVMRVRRAALERFGETAIPVGEPLATLEEALVPLYLHHRYQLEAAAKVVGGAYYTYAMRGDGQEPLRWTTAAEQEKALEALLATLDPEELKIPEDVLEILPPRPFTYPRHRELFERYTGLIFDPVAPASVAAEMTISMLLHPQRAARLVEQHARSPELPGLGDVIDRITGATFLVEPADGYAAEIARAVQRVFAEEVMQLAAEAPMPQVRAVSTEKLVDGVEYLREQLDAAPPGELSDADRAHYRLLVRDIERFLERSAEAADRPEALAAPPGSPIGGGASDALAWPVLGCGVDLPWPSRR